MIPPVGACVSRRTCCRNMERAVSNHLKQRTTIRHYLHDIFILIDENVQENSILEELHKPHDTISFTS